MRDVGDGDEDAPSPPVVPWELLREHRVVEVARVVAVDGHERRGAQILAAAQRDAARALGLGQRLRREAVGDAMGVDADQADGARLAHAPQALDDLRRA